MTRVLGAVALIALCAALYLTRLGNLPVYFGGDEAHFANQAYSIATTGLDISGHRLPLFVNLTDRWAGTGYSVRWYQPVYFYMTAAVLRMAPLAEWSVRLPAAIVGTLDVVLMYLLAAALFKSYRLAALAAALLATSPAHIIFSRQATDYMCILPFAIAWLWLIVDGEKLRGNRAVATGLLLGAGVYSYLSAWMLMPGLLAVTLFVQARAGAGAMRRWAPLVAGFVIPLLPGLWWVPHHPQMISDTLARYHVAGGQGWAFSSVVGSFDYFDPRLLFLRGGASMTSSTHRSGVFPLAMIVLLPLGLFAIVRARPSIPAWVLVAGLLLAPLPAAIAGERLTIQRALLLLPFGVLLGVYGVRWLLARPSGAPTAIALVLLASVPAQTAYFLYDYAGHYQRRSAFYFDPVDVKDAARFVIDADRLAPVPAVYLSVQLDDIVPRWRFHLTREGRQDLLSRSRCLDCEPNDVATAQPGSLAIVYADAPKVAPYITSGRWTVAAVIRDVDSREATSILRRVR